ncbi:ABC transporter ATP-binding protein [Erwiniaceae bacterium BAC15a-03b]|uniref:ABC transporter ATP-binding protein n=1 Tax=Winslowiella arboricola TaxID=2978220 RepID=A0A9J6Q0A0_9GAMM|nr:ABC transporter ATP-binding protein [Winslowiella arboricola]MCU5772984.1 ABC transporter ATP-binding protein [Winslowiella arboricola]MCU5780588.1 ABC transporter ATP-binding protein [Winslowiella arboricola]
MNPQAKALLEVRNLQVSVGDRLVVKGISFALAEREVLAVVGESGSGKTLAMRALIGLLPANIGWRADAMQFAGGSLLNLSAGQLREVRGAGIGMVFQEPMTSLNPAMSIGRQLDEGLVLHTTLTAPQRKAKIIAMLERVGLNNAASLLTRFPHEFSGGMRQRVMIASVMLLEPKLIIADEPTTALDVLVQHEVMELMLALTAEKGSAVILISHDLSMVANYASRIMVMEQGELVEQNSSHTLLASPQHPYTRRLLDALPTRKAAPDRQTLFAAQPVIGLQDIVIDYEGRKGWFKPRTLTRAVNGVSFNVRAGETVALVGASGSGKTTIGKLIAGMVQASAGSLTFMGQPLENASRAQRQSWRMACQMIQQDPYSSLNPRMKVAQLLEEPLLLLAQMNRRARLDRIKQVLEEVGLDAMFLARYPHQLSGGQRQRVAIARAIIRRPAFIIADEPTSALDMTVQKQIILLLKKLQQSYGFACLFITHDLGAVEQIADRIMVMEQGLLVESGWSDDVLDQPQHDYTRRLLSCLPRLTPLANGGYQCQEAVFGSRIATGTE